MPPALNAADGLSFNYTLTANEAPPPYREPGLEIAEAVAGDRIGAAVAVAGTTLAVGAPGIEGRGVVYRPGVMHLFKRYGKTWAKDQEVAPADGEVGDFFGVSAALGDGPRAGSAAGDTLVVGAPRVDAVYVFVRGGQGLGSAGQDSGLGGGRRCL